MQAVTESYFVGQTPISLLTQWREANQWQLTYQRTNHCSCTNFLSFFYQLFFYKSSFETCEWRAPSTICWIYIFVGPLMTSWQRPCDLGPSIQIRQRWQESFSWTHLFPSTCLSHALWQWIICDGSSALLLPTNLHRTLVKLILLSDQLQFSKEEWNKIFSELFCLLQSLVTNFQLYTLQNFVNNLDLMGYEGIYEILKSLSNLSIICGSIIFIV